MIVSYLTINISYNLNLTLGQVKFVLFEKKVFYGKAAVETEIKQMEKTLALLKFKCRSYETAMADGNEDNFNAMLPDKLPKGIQELYDKGHE